MVSTVLVAIAILCVGCIGLVCVFGIDDEDSELKKKEN